MPYSNKEYKETNVNYLNKDFSSLKLNLIEYAKSYFPNTYRDFNETSPGMMLIEMGAYVGDVLSFYIDNQYKEMMLPLVEERRNVINIANTLGYKVSPVSPAYVNITVTQIVGVNNSDINRIMPNYDQTLTIDKGLKLISTVDKSVTFETLDVVDFTISSSQYLPEENTFDENGMVSEYKLTRLVKAISGETKTKTFSIGSPTQFRRLILDETNVIEVINVTDSSGNTWYEVDYLAQDKVPLETHYTDDWINYNVHDNAARDNGYEDLSDVYMGTAVPYTLTYLQTPKRFITEVNDDNTTSLVFGNGLLRTGTTGSLSSNLLFTEQAGISVPGEPSSYATTFSPTLGSSYSSLGETPSNTVINVEYRVGGGINSNVPAGDLVTYNNVTVLNTDSYTAGSQNLSINNSNPARGGSSGETIEEIRQRSKAYFSTQNRCVTKEDYEARTMALPAKFGSIAKAYVKRSDPGDLFASLDVNSTDSNLTLPEFESLFDGSIPTIELYTLSYNNFKNLVQSPSLLKSNLSEYLDQFRIITDDIAIKGGYIINFGVFFDVVSDKTSNKSEVKLRCINKIKDYFSIEKMQFKQTIHTSELGYELMGLEGVRGINYIILGQGASAADLGDYFTTPLYGKTGIPGSESDIGNGTDPNYGWFYDFTQFYGDAPLAGDGVVLPSIEPAVFELKNPNKNVKGIVR